MDAFIGLSHAHRVERLKKERGVLALCGFDVTQVGSAWSGLVYVLVLVDGVAIFRDGLNLRIVHGNSQGFMSVDRYYDEIRE